MIVFNTCQLAPSQCRNRNIVQTHGQWWLWSLKGFVVAEGNGRIGGREKGASNREEKEQHALEWESSPAPWWRQWVLSSFPLSLCGAVGTVINITIKAPFLNDNPYEQQSSLEYSHVCAIGTALWVTARAYVLAGCGQSIGVQWTLGSVGVLQETAWDKGKEVFCGQ